MPVSLIINRTVSFFSDLDEAGQFDPGDVIYTRVTIQNAGDTAATGVTIEDNFVSDSSFGVTLGAINVSPIAFNDSFTAIGNTVLRVGGAATINGGESTIVSGNLLSNDRGDVGGGAGTGPITNDQIQGFKIDVVGDGTHAGGGVSANGGRFNIFADGSFNYVNDGTDTTLTSDSFTYTIRDKGLDNTYNTADDLTSSATVTITFAVQGAAGSPAHRVWYVDSAAAPGGDGTSAKPFQSMTAINGVTGDGTTNDDLDQAGEFIYVENSGGAPAAVNGPITLEADQDLIGTGSALVVAGVTLANAASNSTLTAASGTIVTLGTGNVIAGLNIGNGSGSATGLAGTSFGTVSVSNVALNTGGQALNLAVGTVGGTGFTSTTSTGGVQNVLTIDVNGTLALGTGSMTGATSNSLSVSGGNLVLTYGGNVTNASTTGAAVRAASGHNGSLTFTGTIQSTDGTGLQFDNADGTYNFNGTNTLSGGDAGIDILNGSSGTFNFSSNSSINHGGSGHAFVVDTSNATVTYSGTITDNSGRAVSITEHDGASITFGGAITGSGAGAAGIHVVSSNGGGTIAFNGPVTLTTQANNAITLSSNTGKIIEFSGAGTGVDLNTTSGTGFSASGGGTITVLGSGNSIVATTGTALNVANTTIGANDLNFASISKNGGSVAGIILNGTGSTGGLNITGTGGANSGGTIQNITGQLNDAIVLTNTSNFNATNLRIDNIGGHGINATNLGGVNTVGSSHISDWNQDQTASATKDGIRIVNTNTNMTSMVITNTLFDGSEVNSATVTGNDGVFMEVQGSSSMNLRVEDSTFQHMFGDGIQVNGSTFATGTINLRIIDNDFLNAVPYSGGPGVGGGNGGISLAPFGDVNMFVDIDQNTFTNVMLPITNLGAINMTNGLTANADITIRNNTIKGVEGSRGISLSADGSSVTRLMIDNNNLDDLGSNHGGFVVNLNDTASADVIVQNNDIGQNPAIAGRLWTDGATLNHAILLQALGNTFMRATVNNNIIDANSGSVIEVVRLRAASVNNPTSPAPTIHASVTNNNIQDTDVATRVEFDATAGNSTDETGTIHLNITGNNLNSGGRIQLTERTLGDINVVQAGEVAIEAVNPGSNAVIAAGSPDFSQAAPQSPTAPTLPGTPLFAETPPEPEPEEKVVDTPDVDDGGDGESGGGEPAGETPVPAGPVVIDDGLLSQAELDLIVAAAIQRWADAGATADQIAAMRAVTISVSNLGGMTLGSSNAGTIAVDDDAAGWRWFVDETPGDDSEYQGSGTRLSATDTYGHAGTRMDLLTVVTHELGHQIGLTDSYSAGDRDELMYGTVRAGERRLPGSDDLEGASGTAVSGAFAVAPIDIGTLPAGQTVTIEWRSTINAPGEDRPVHFIIGQTSVVGNNFSTAQSDANPGLAGDQPYFQIVDGLRLSGLLYLDGNKDGDFDVGTESGLSNVTLLLFADSNNDGNYDLGTDLAVVYQDANNNNVYDAGDTPLAPGSSGAGVKQLTATSAVATGLYSFDNLAPGDYIVVVPDSNFGAGSLGNRVAHGSPAAPNNNVDSDNNAEQFLTGQPGTYAATRAIRLDYGQETVAGPAGTANDTNDTLDLGFDQPNQPPAIANLQGDAVTFVEGGTALRIDSGTLATITDSDSPNFNTGSLTVAIAANKDSSEDQLGIDTAGTGVTIVGSTVSVDGFAVGTLSGGGAGGGDLVIAFNTDDATPARIAKILNAVTYFNSDATSPSTLARTISITLVDGDGEAGGGDDDSTVTTTVNVTAVNDAPAGTDNIGALTTAEDTRLVLTAADFGFIDGDANAFAGFVLTTAPAIGTLYIDTDGAGGSLGTALAAGNFVAIADINAGRLVYVPNANASGAETFTFQVRDDGGTLNGGVDTDASANTIGITVTAVNDLPTIDLNAGGAGINNVATFTEDGAAVVLANALVLADADNTSLASATLTIGGFQAGDVLTISGTQSGTSNNVNYSYDSATGIMSLSGTALLSDYQAALRLVTFSTPNQNPSASRTISWAVNDGTGTGPAANTALTINAVNDSPSGADKTVSVNEDDSYTFTLADFGFSDPAEGHGLMSIFVNGVPVQGDLRNNGVLVNSGDYILPGDVTGGFLVFTPDPGTFGVAYGDFSFQLFDDGGTANGGVNFDQSSNKITIDVTPDNVSPLLDLNGAPAGQNNTANVTEQSPAVTLAPNLAVSDTDDTDLEGATVSITGGFQTSDALSVAGVTNGSSGTINWTYTPGTGVLAFTGTATVAAYEAVLKQVALVVGGDAPGATRTVSWTVNDGNSNSVARTTAVTVTQVNDAPSGTNNTLTISEDATHVFTLADFGFSDVEGHSFAAVAITTLPNNGTLVRNNVAIASAGTVVLAQDIIDGKLVFRPDQDENGTPYGTFTFQVVDGGGSANGGQDTDQSANSFTFNVTAVEDLPVANNDTGSTTESATTVISVLTNDTDPDGPPLQVAEIAGVAVVAGQTVVLASGATAKLENDGTITYNPNGVYNSLTAPGSGAVNTSANDTFTYKLVGGTGTANVSVTVNGVVSADDRLKGDGGDNVITGTPQRDIFELQQGGNDTVHALPGNDTFYFGAAFTAGDTVNAGDGVDAIILQGNYSAGVTLGTGTTSNISGLESIALAPGNYTAFGDTAGNFYSYNLTMLDSNVASGAGFKVNGFTLRAGENFTFNGAAETDARFTLYAGQGVDTWTGGGQGDFFIFGHDGRFGAGDVVNGGGGYDNMYLRGDYAIDFNAVGFAGSLVGIESVTVGAFADDRFVVGGDGEFDYSFIWNNSMLATGEVMVFNGSRLGAAETLAFDGSSETGGHFRLWGGAGDDTLTGGGGEDLLYGGLGADALRGNGGADQFRYYETAESAPGAGNFDSIVNFTHLTDKIDLSGIDANSAAAGDQAFSFIGSAAFAGTGASSAGQLRAFLQNVGTNTWEVQGDVNGDGVADLMIRVTVEAVQPLTVGDFLL